MPYPDDYRTPDEPDADPREALGARIETCGRELTGIGDRLAAGGVKVMPHHLVELEELVAGLEAQWRLIEERAS